MKKLKFIKVQANADNDEPAEMSIRGAIGSSFDMNTWTMKTTEDEVLDELSQIPKGKKINVRINSPGGDFGIALGCYSALASRYDDVTTYNCGYACSAASVLMLAGKNRVSPVSCNWMIHCGSSETSGTAIDHQHSIDMLNSINKTMANTYAKATGVGTPEEWLAKMEKETWFTGPEACDAKLGTSADGTTDSPEIEMTAEAKKIVATFKHIPTILQPRFTVAASAAVPPPTNNNQPKIKSMKKIIAALVASGITCAEDANEETVLAHVNSVISQRDGLKTQVDAVAVARKTRIEAAVNLAVTDKIVAEGRKASMIATGIASAEGETVILDQITDLREAKATTRRGAPAVARGPQTGEEESIEELLEQQKDAVASGDGDKVATVVAKLRLARGRKEPLFEEPQYTRARN